MRKFRLVLAGAALTVAFFASQKPATAIPSCAAGGPPYSCLCLGHWYGCVANAAACASVCNIS